MSLLLQNHFQQEHKERAEQTAATIRSMPLPFDPRQFSIGQLLDNLRVVRFPRNEKTQPRTVLAEHVTTGTPVLATEGNSHLKSGDVFRAVVDDTSSEFGVHASQSKLSDWYAESIGKDLYAVIADVSRDRESEEIYALWLQLEPGLKGQLKRTDVHIAAWDLLADTCIGETIEVAVKAVTENGRIQLETADIRRGRLVCVADGDSFLGRIKTIMACDGSVFGCVVEFTVGREGFLPRENVVHSWEVDSWTVGQCIDVVVEDVDDKPRILLVSKPVAELREQTSHEDGDVISGAVAEFDETRHVEPPKTTRQLSSVQSRSHRMCAAILPTGCVLSVVLMFGTVAAAAIWLLLFPGSSFFRSPPPEPVVPPKIVASGPRTPHLRAPWVPFRSIEVSLGPVSHEFQISSDGNVLATMYDDGGAFLVLDKESSVTPIYFQRWNGYEWISLALSGDGSTVIALHRLGGHYNYGFHVGDLANGLEDGYLQTRQHKMALSENGSVLLLSGRDGVEVFQRETISYFKRSRELFVVERENKILYGRVSVSSDGNLGAVGFYEQGTGRSSVALFNVVTRLEIRSLTSDTTELQPTLSPSGRLLAIYRPNDVRVDIIEVENCRTLSSLIDCRHKPRFIERGNDGILVAGISDARIQFWDACSGTVIWSAAIDNGAADVAVSQDGMRLAILDTRGTVHVYDRKEHSELKAIGAAYRKDNVHAGDAWDLADCEPKASYEVVLPTSLQAVPPWSRNRAKSYEVGTGSNLTPGPGYNSQNDLPWSRNRTESYGGGTGPNLTPGPGFNSQNELQTRARDIVRNTPKPKIEPVQPLSAGEKP